MKISKSSFIKLIDLAAFILISILISTGSLLKFTLPRGSGRDAIWYLNRHEWGDIHFYVSLFFMLTIITHLLMHSRFIKKAILGRGEEKPRRVVIGTVLLIVFIFILVTPLLSPIDSDKTKEKYDHRFGNDYTQAK